MVRQLLFLILVGFLIVGCGDQLRRKAAIVPDAGKPRSPKAPQYMLPRPDEWIEQGVVLSPSSSGWDSFGKDYFGGYSMVKKGGTYYLYYHAPSGPRQSDGGPAYRAIGVATSKDGAHFTKYSGNPIMTHVGYGLECNWEEEGASQPTVALDDSGKFIMFFAAKTAVTCSEIKNDIYVTTSSDGFNFGKFSDADLIIPHTIDPGGDEIMPNGIVHYPGSDWYLWYNTDGFGGRKTSLAYGSSPYSLKQHSGNPVLGMRHNSQVLHPDKKTITVVAQEGSYVNVRETTISNPGVYSSSRNYFTNVGAGFVFLDTDEGVWRWYYNAKKGGDILKTYLRTAPLTSGSIAPPSPPSKLYFDRTTETTTCLNWVDNSNDKDGFYVYRSDTSTKPSTVKMWGSAQCTR